MRNLLIPSGQINFRGNPVELKPRIQNLGGMHIGERQFSCQFSWPSNGKIYFNLFGLHFFRFDFRCVYRSVGALTEISYEVFPHFSSCRKLILPLLIIFNCLFTLQKQECDPAAFLFFLSILAVCFSLFFIARKNCIRQFLDSFSD